jgi:hypothetical protein
LREDSAYSSLAPGTGTIKAEFMNPVVKPAPSSGKGKQLLDQMRDVMRLKHSRMPLIGQTRRSASYRTRTNNTVPYLSNSILIITDYQTGVINSVQAVSDAPG